MRLKLASLFLFFCLGAASQEVNRKAIPGTKISLIPPDGFVPSAQFAGFQQDATGTSIMVNELAGPITQVGSGFTSEGLKSKGMTLIEKKTVDWNNTKATLIFISQPANGTTYLKQILMFGDEKNTILVNGAYPEVSKAIETSITASLLSARYNAAQDDNPLAAAPFQVDVAGTGFVVAKYLSGSLIYTKDGKIPTQSADKAAIMVASSLGQPAAGDKKEFAIERMKKLPRGESTVLKTINPISINNLEGFEIVADGKDAGGKKQLVYQVMLFTPSDEYYIIVGYSIAAFDSYLATFKQVAKTFRQK